MTFYKQARYSYWLTAGFLKKHIKIIVAVCLSVILLLLFSSALLESLTVWFSLNKRSIGMVRSSDGSIPPEIVEQVSKPLVGFDEQGRFKPILAQKISVNKTGTEYLLQLRNGLSWEDGQLFTASTIPQDTITFPKVTTEIINDETVKFTLPRENPLAPFPSLLSRPLTKKNFTGVRGDYRLRSIRYKAGLPETVILTPQEPLKPVLQYRLYNSSNDLLLGYKLGEVSQYETYDPTLVTPVEKWKNTKVTTVPDAKKIVTLFINTQRPPLDNRNIRQAIAQAIDYDALSQYGVRAYSPLVPFSWAFNRDIRTYEYEPDIVRGILKQQSEEKRLSLYTSYEQRAVAENIKKSMENAGFKIDIRYTNYFQPNYDLYLASFEPGIDPDQYVFWHSTQKQQQGNLSNLVNVRIDKLLEDGRSAMTEKKRKESYFKLQEVLADEVPAIFIYHPYLYIVQRT